MIKRLSMILGILLVSCAYPASFSGSQKQWNPINAFRSTVKIALEVEIPKMGRGAISGTAWAIDRDHLITAGHVCGAFIELKDAGVAKDLTITYLSPNGYQISKKANEIEILLSDSANDICILKYQRHGFVPLKLAKDVAFGETVYVIGAPLGLLGFVFQGMVVNLGIDFGESMKNKMVISAAATGGNSGGPVVNQNGEVIGILIAGSTSFDHFSICTRLGVLYQTIKILEK